MMKTTVERNNPVSVSMNQVTVWFVAIRQPSLGYSGANRKSEMSAFMTLVPSATL